MSALMGHQSCRQLVIDQCASGKGGSSHGSDLEGGSRGGNVKWTTTLGLVVHAAADGIAMGAAATTRQTDIEGAFISSSHNRVYDNR